MSTRRSPRFEVRECSQADAEHAAHPRVFAHVGHKAGVICIARAFRSYLPDNYVYAILLHELGHLALLTDTGHNERDADRHGGELAGVTIRRRSWGGLRNLEYVSTADLVAARRVVHQLTDYRPLRGTEPWAVSR